MTPITKVEKLTRSQQVEKKKQAILTAAFDEFVDHGYAGARMELIAKKAGVAKGTVFLHFTDKKTLFIELIKLHVLPVFSKAFQNDSDKILRIQLEELFLPILERLPTSKAFAIIQLILAEGKRFPELTELYYDLVISKGIEKIKQLIDRARKNEKDSIPPALIQYPHLLFAPLIMSFLWQTNFQTYYPIDFKKMVSAHLDILFSNQQ